MSYHNRRSDTHIALDPHQWAARENETRFDVRVWARRSGKTYYTILRMIERMDASGKNDWQSFYFAPTRVQAQQIAFPYLSHFAGLTGGNIKRGELKVEWPGRGFIQLMGGENFERARGLYVDDCTFDEAAQIPSAAWLEVISPAISDRGGRVTFMGTPRGRHNLLEDMFEHAGEGHEEWSRDVITAYDAGRLTVEEIERNKRQMSEAQFNQEFLCSFEGSLRGAFYMREMQDANIRPCAYDNTLQVTAALDLGHTDLMPVIFHQGFGTEQRIIDVRAYQFTSIPEMVADWRKSLPFPVDHVIMPHDAKVTSLTDGKTREQVMRDLGFNVSIAPRTSLEEGIEMTRRFLRYCIFDTENTRILREALNGYRTEFDEVRRVHSTKPLHSWESHYADAMRYLATGDKASATTWGERGAFRGAI